MTTIRDLLDKKPVEVVLNSQRWELDKTAALTTYTHGYVRLSMWRGADEEVEWGLSADNNLLRGSCKSTTSAAKVLNSAVRRLLKRMSKARQTCTNELRDIEVSIYLLTTL